VNAWIYGYAQDYHENFLHRCSAFSLFWHFAGAPIFCVPKIAIAVPNLDREPGAFCS
jgi:hypothetical protein